MKRLAFGLALLASPAPAFAANLDVVVTGVRSDRGDVAVAVCDKANFPSGTCSYRARVPARVGSVTVHLTDVASGTWAAAVYHDEENRGRLEFSLFGTPKQGFGFSRDAKMHFGPPAFADAAFTVVDANAAVTNVTVIVPLHYPP